MKKSCENKACPNCGEPLTIQAVYTGATVTEFVGYWKNKAYSPKEHNASVLSYGDLIRFESVCCGTFVLDKSGNPITEHSELTEYLKELRNFDK